MTISWRRFKFYQDAETRSIDFPNTPLCCATSLNELFFGCEGGEVMVLDATLGMKFAFVAHGHSVLFLHFLRGANLVLTLGTEEPGVSSATLKVWSVEKLFAEGDQRPMPLKSQKLFSARFPESEMTAMTVRQRWEGHAVVAVGLASGMVYWMQGDVMKDRWTWQKLHAQPLGSSDRFCVKGLGIHGVQVKYKMI